MQSHEVPAETDLLHDPNAAVELPPLSPDAIAQPDLEPAFDSRPFALLVSEIGEETAAEALAIFVEETDARLPRLRTLASLDDRVKLEREAHSLKGAAATFGLTRSQIWPARSRTMRLRLRPKSF